MATPLLIIDQMKNDESSYQSIKKTLNTYRHDHRVTSVPQLSKNSSLQSLHNNSTNSSANIQRRKKRHKRSPLERTFDLQSSP